MQREVLHGTFGRMAKPNWTMRKGYTMNLSSNQELRRVIMDIQTELEGDS